VDHAEGEVVYTDVAKGEEGFPELGVQAGSAPGDRAWRPDVEGLRAIAVALVLALHFSVPGFVGGYVGVDVFFVISGFVITGLLLRENLRTGGTSLVDFYARRCRRILPAATLVILVTVIATYVLVDSRFGKGSAQDGIWAAAFAFNFHHFYPGWNPLSPFDHYWSLSVEEQFYIVFPMLFLAAAKIKGTGSIRTRLAVGLGIVIAASYSLSILQSRTDASWAFVSPLTRAWELALGALVAVSTQWLLRVPSRLAAALTWIGLGAIFCSVFTTGVSTHDYPGWRVAIPVVGTAMVIAGGIAVPRFGVESLIGTWPFRWLGKRSYALYLWHWSALIVASEAAGNASLWKVRVPSFVVSLVLTVATYHWVENPARRWKLPSRQMIGFGLGLVVATITVLSTMIALSP